jgi:hypothetical protein
MTFPSVVHKIWDIHTRVVSSAWNPRHVKKIWVVNIKTIGWKWEKGNKMEIHASKIVIDKHVYIKNLTFLYIHPWAEGLLTRLYSASSRQIPYLYKFWLIQYIMLWVSSFIEVTQLTSDIKDGTFFTSPQFLVSWGIVSWVYGPSQALRGWSVERSNFSFSSFSFLFLLPFFFFS